jgi:hypothetical protein
MRQKEKIEDFAHLRGLTLRPLKLIIMISMLTSVYSYAQGGWSVNSSFQVTSGDYITSNTTNNYYFNIGSRYQAEEWYISANISIIAQDGLFPESDGNDMMGGSGMSHLNMGIGDLYMFGEVNLLKGTNVLPWIALSSQIKIPTASSINNLGTGEFDYGIGLILRKPLTSFIIFGDIGYLNLGDPEEITFLNPITFGIGLGRGFDYGNYSLSVYYQRYTKIYEAYPAPHQLSLGLYANIINRTFLSIIGSKGLSKTTPDFSISAGIEYYF